MIKRKKAKARKGKKANPILRSYGKTEFWQDHHHLKMAIVVESDDPNYPVIAALPYKTRSEECERIARAIKMLASIEKGRWPNGRLVNLRELASRVPEEYRWERRYEGNRG